jgi:hypothetical protein
VIVGMHSDDAVWEPSPGGLTAFDRCRSPSKDSMLTIERRAVSPSSD